MKKLLLLPVILTLVLLSSCKKEKIPTYINTSIVGTWECESMNLNNGNTLTGVITFTETTATINTVDYFFGTWLTNGHIEGDIVPYIYSNDTLYSYDTWNYNEPKFMPKYLITISNNTMIGTELISNIQYYEDSIEYIEVSINENNTATYKRL